MTVPERNWRGSAAAIASLAARFSLPNTPDMQDWEWEVADASRIDEFIGAYRGGELDENETFLLAEMLMQSFEDIGATFSDHPSWGAFMALLDENLEHHLHTIWYWGDPEDEADFFVSRELRKLIERHRARFEGAIDGAG